MRHPILSPRVDQRVAVLGAAAVAVALIVAADAYLALRTRSANAAETAAASPSGTAASTADSETVQLSDSQLGSIKVGPVVDRDFPIEKTRSVTSILTRT
jgi:hypothetical protein